MGVEKDPVRAAEWYRKAAEQGSKLAQFSLARLYETGKGVPRDIEKALDWYRWATKSGYRGAAEKIEALTK